LSRHPGAAYRDGFPCLWEGRDKLNKEQKQQAVQTLKEKFLRAKGMVITEYKGMTVAEISELRDSLRGGAVEYRVIKNTLARIAAEDTPVAPARDSFRGPVGIALSYDDAVQAAKGVLEFTKKNQKLKVTAGVIEGSFFSSGDLKAVAELPPREVLLSMTAGVLQAPLSKMARLLQATVCGFAYGLSALKEKRAR
jgi:large subunit ribosomal protein L10